MNSRSLIRIAAAFLLVAGAARAELSVNGHGSEVFFQAPPGQIWTKFRQGVPSSHLLNPFGDERGDGIPSFAVNPYTGAPEVTWPRAGSNPALMFASWDADADAWNVRAVSPGRGATDWAGRAPKLVHDGRGNRFISLDDPQTGNVLLASAPPLSQHVNRPIRVNPPGIPGARPVMVWDGHALVIAFERQDLPGGIGIVELVPVTDEEGFIPNGGEGVPGIPEPVFGYLGDGPRVPLSGGSGFGPGLVVPTVPPPAPGGASDSPQEYLALIRIEEIPGDRLMVSWIDRDHLDYTVRDASGAWSDVAAVPLADPVEHEEARAEARRSLTGSRR